MVCCCFSQIAKLTHAISVFTEGILMMKTTLVGIIKVRISMVCQLIYSLFATMLLYVAPVHMYQLVKTSNRVIQANMQIKSFLCRVVVVVD